MMAQVCMVPATTSLTPVSCTVAGCSELVVVPSPSCPNSLAPQQNADPLPCTAHVCSLPAVTAVISIKLGTSCGTGMVIALLDTPVCQFELAPQQATRPEEVTAQV